MFSINAQQYEDFKKLLPQWAPETELDTPRGVMEVDQQRRQVGAQPTTLGAAIEQQYLQPRAFDFSGVDPAESDAAPRGLGLTPPSSRSVFGGLLGLPRFDEAYRAVRDFRLDGPQTLGESVGSGLSELGSIVGDMGSFSGFFRRNTTGLNGQQYGWAQGLGGAVSSAIPDGARRPLDMLLAPGTVASGGLKTALTSVGGSLGLGYGAEEGAARLGATPEQQAVARAGGEFVGGIAGAGLGMGGAKRALETEATSNPTVQKLVDFINVAKPAQKEQAGLYSAARSARAGKVADVLSGQTGEAAFQAARGELGGALPKVQFASPRPEFSQDEINSLFDTVRTAPGLRPFDRINVSDALTTALAGQVPTRSEIAGLEKVFGTDLAKALQSRRSLGAKAKEIGGELLQAPRTLQASWDASAPFRQGIILSVAHPISATRATGAMIKAMASEAGAEAVDDAIRTAPWAREAEIGKLYRAPLFGDFGKMTDREEAFMGNIVERLPLIGRGVRASERGYVTYLNKLRDDVFGNVVSDWPAEYRANPANLEKMGSFLNVASGRGDLGWLENHAPTLNAAFFSPRYFTSRVQVNWQGLKAAADLGKSAALGQAFDPASKQIAGDLAKFYATGITALGMLKASGAADVELDPRSSDFGKVRIGSTRYDFWAGQQQIARFVANLVRGEKKSPTTGTVYDTPRKQVVVDFLRSKLAPVPGLVADAYAGQTGTGDTVDLTADSLRTQAWNRLTPFFIHDTIDAIHKEGLAGGFKALPSGVGVGYQRFGEERVPLDQKSQEMFGSGYNDISPSQQREVQAQLPDVMSKLNADTIKRGGASGENLKDRQDMLTKLNSIDPNLTGKAFRDRVGDIETEARIRREKTAEILGKPAVTPGSPQEKALSEYYDALSKAGDGSVDWEATDAKRSELEKSWTPEQKAYVDQETGAVDPNLPPRVKELKETQHGLDSSGYYDLRNNAWQRFAQANNVKGAGDDYYKYKDAVVRSWSDAYQKQGYSDVAANQYATQAFDKQYSAFTSWFANSIRPAWEQKNPELALRAVRDGYLNPSGQDEINYLDSLSKWLAARKK